MLYGPIDILAEFPTQRLLNGESVVLGEEDIDGKKTTVLHISSKMGKMKETGKIWIWNDRGLPLKAEGTSNMDHASIQGALVQNHAVSTYQYFGFDDIPDKLFDVTEMLNTYKEIIPETTGTVSSEEVTVEIPSSGATH